MTRFNATRYTFTFILAVAAMAVRPASGTIPEGEGRRTNSVLLNGDWEYVTGDGDEHAETQEGAGRLKWQKVRLPGTFMPWSEKAVRQTRAVWTRRRFTVSPAQAASLAVLRWNQISNGAAAFINGQKAGENAPTGPYQVILPAGALKAGENSIVIKVTGAAAVPRAKSGSALIPAGFGPAIPAVHGDVWIDFAEDAYMKWILAMPDVMNEKVRIRVTLNGIKPAAGLSLSAVVRSWPDGPEIGRGGLPASLTPNPDPLGGDHFDVEVPMPGFKPWTFEQPNLYTAQVTLRRGASVLDSAPIRFGMRQITVENGHYRMNGKTLRLRGSELVFEWQWADTEIIGNEKTYLVTEAREMNMNAFRTHTMPPPPLWADLCDEHGTMLLAEFPCLYNYQNYRFTPAEYEIWHKNVISDAAGWMARLWNHPSVVMWVLSNESNRDSAWEAGPYHDFVRALDPTRPTMRTGDTGTAENYDVHICRNTVDPVEGELILSIPTWFRKAGGRPVTNSEYMNIFKRPITQWTGNEDKGADALAYAQLGMEHTEAMRRARLDGMLPYMYAGWTRTRTGETWKGGFAKPVSACWHSALSPVLASLDLFDPNYLTGQEVRTDLFLINDSWHEASIHVDLLLTQDCPEFIPEAACLDRPLARWSYDFTLPADTMTRTPMSWRLPEREGSYWLTARTTGLPGRPVLSQRFVRAAAPPEVTAAVKKRRFVLLGGDAAAESWFRSRGLRAGHEIQGLVPGESTVVIWDAARLTPAERKHAAVLREFAAAGGCIVVLATRSWDWTGLCDLRIGNARASRAFPYPETRPAMLEGIRPDWLSRWNGLPGTVATGNLEGPALADAKKILWVREPQTCIAAEVPVAGGKGRILFSQLNVQQHLDRSWPDYDPVAEKVLINMFSGEAMRP